MFTNLPKIFPIERIKEFSFGEVEAKVDELLDDNMCICLTRPIIEFLNGRKTIVVGARGSGKSSVFRMLRKNTISFIHDESKIHLILTIDEEFSYKTLKNLTIDKIKLVSGNNSILSYRIIWEIFIINNILNFIFEKMPQHGDDEIKQIKKIFSDFTGETSPTYKLTDILSKAKATFGIKLDSAYGGAVVVPNAYASFEPAQYSKPDTDEAIHTINIDNIKFIINKFLQRHNILLHFMIDKLDEFVTGEEYLAQKECLQALIECERSYQGFDSLLPAIFIRNDLFQRLDFDSIGKDKVLARCVTLKWSEEEIREFMARRIAKNLFKLLKLDHFSYKFQEELLYIDTKSIDSAEITESQDVRHSVLYEFASKILSYITKRQSIAGKSNGRRVNFNDQINRFIITLIFPHRTMHKGLDGRCKSIELWKYLETHFCLGSTITTPRLMLMFLQKCISNTIDYYYRNPDLVVSLNAQNEYELVLNVCIEKAYEEFRADIIDVFTSTNKNWQSMTTKLISKLSSQYRFSCEAALNVFTGKTEDEVHNLLAYLCHIGIITCINPNSEQDLREYEFPILFKNC